MAGDPERVWSAPVAAREPPSPGNIRDVLERRGLARREEDAGVGASALGRLRQSGWFIHENAPGVKAVLSELPAAASINHPFAQYRA